MYVSSWAGILSAPFADADPAARTTATAAAAVLPSVEGATNGFSPPPIELEETPSQADDDLDLSADLHRFNSDSLLDEPESAPTTESLSEQSPSSRGEALVVEEDHVEEWEADLEECISAATEPRPWSELRKQIMTDLTKRKNTLTLAQTNQLLIIQNFANLRIKGQKRMEASMAIAQQWHESSNPVYFARKIRALARHYQLFEQLPDEGRGGSKNGRSLLDDPLLVTALRNWLTSQPVGSVTPRNFQHAVNTALLPSLGISLKSPICYRTAQRWLVKVGWRLTVLRKGVYMDGHERPDVVEYRNNVFLPKMAEYERRMVHFEGPDLTRVEPVLKEGETEIVVYFQDESCFHANEYKSRAWCVRTSGRFFNLSQADTDFLACQVGPRADGVAEEEPRTPYPCVRLCHTAHRTRCHSR